MSSVYCRNPCLTLIYFCFLVTCMYIIFVDIPVVSACVFKQQRCLRHELVGNNNMRCVGNELFNNFWIYSNLNKLYNIREEEITLSYVESLDWESNATSSAIELLSLD